MVNKYLETKLAELFDVEPRKTCKRENVRYIAERLDFSERSVIAVLEESDRFRNMNPSQGKPELDCWELVK